MEGETLFLSDMKNIRERIELLEILAEADEDVKYGRVTPVKDTFDDLRSLLKEGKA